MRGKRENKRKKPKGKEENEMIGKRNKRICKWDNP